MAGSPAVEVEQVHKSFLLPHHLRTSVKEIFLHPFRSTDYERQIALDDVSFTVERGEFVRNRGREWKRQEHTAEDHRRHPPPRQWHRSSARSALAVHRARRRLQQRADWPRQHSDQRHSARTFEERTARRYDDIVAFAELERFVDQKLKNYSSGMQVRLAYSIAIQVDFDVLLLDEVLAVGDERFQAKCFETFEQMRAAGKTVLFVSHDLDALARFCARAVLIERGKQIVLGPTAEVIDCYRSRSARPAVPAIEHEAAASIG